MAQLTLTINGRNYGIACEDGQEQRVMDLAHYVDSKIKDIARAGAGTNESHLLVLTALMLSDEIFDLRDQVDEQGGQTDKSEAQKHDELIIAQAIDHLADRIDTIAERIKAA
ncbi:MAG: cell division protein ZapA [Alphaproteobacteria bacterium]|nr:cell division protein ZapA [Alphaproteobacteria bacterium]